MYEYVWSSGTPPTPRHHAYDYDPPQLTIAQMTLAAMYMLRSPAFFCLEPEPT